MVKRGVTLIELVVSMGIFMIVITIAIGAFVSVSRMKALTSTMKDAQQKTRITLEMITRLSRQADKVIVIEDIVTGKGKELELYFGTKVSPEAVRFKIETTGELNYFECEKSGGIIIGDLDCAGDWSSPTNLYSEVIVDGTKSSFTKIGTIPATLNVEIIGSLDNAGGNKYYSSNININTTIVLESLK